jgi:hypothetical protein
MHSALAGFHLAAGGLEFHCRSQCFEFSLYVASGLVHKFGGTVCSGCSGDQVPSNFHETSISARPAPSHPWNP